MSDNSQLIEETKNKMLEILQQNLGKGDPEFLYQQALGSLLAEFDYKDSGWLQNNIVGWSLDAYVASSLGPKLNRIALLLDFLQERNATAEHPHDFAHCDRYGCMLLACAGDRIAGFQTQSMTYLVKLTSHPVFSREDPKDSHKSWGLQLRYCTVGRNSYNPECPSFKDLSSQNLENYFRYEDGRDQGFLCSIEPNLLDPGWVAKDTTWNSFKLLQGVIYDLYCHTTFMPGHPD